VGKDNFKILFLSSWYPNKTEPTLGNFVQRHAEAVAAINEEVSALYVCSDPGLKGKNYNIEINDIDNVNTIIVYYKKVRLNLPLISNLLKVYRQLNGFYTGLKKLKGQNKEIDLVHLNVIYPAGTFALLLKLFNKIPYLITEHWTGYMPADGRYNGWWRRWITRKIVKNAVGITTVSNVLKQDMINEGLQSTYHIVPNIVNIPSANQHIDLPGSVTKFLCVADLIDDQKNISGLLEAFGKVIKDNPEVELHIIGNGPDKNELVELSKQRGLYDKSVFFHGEKTHDRLIAFMNSCNCLVVNSRYESFSIVAAEALGCGLPVITTKCGGPEEFVNDEVGKLIDNGNPEQLEEALSVMIQTHKGYDREAIKKYAATKFSNEEAVKKFQHIYQLMKTT